MPYSPTKRSSFGARVRSYVSQSSNRGRMGSGRALGIRFNNWFRPPKNKTTKIRLLPGAYEGFDGVENEYFMYVEHWCERSRKSILCSKEYKMEGGDVMAIGGKCLACDEIERDAGDVGWRLLHAFNAIHLAYYHLEPVLGDDGKEMFRERDGKKEQVFRKVVCEGRRCEHCRKGLEKVFGKKVHWSIGTGHLGDLSGFVDEIEKDCANCGGQGTIEVVSYECSKCGEVVIDMNDTELNDGEIRKIISQPHTCRECKNRDLLLEQKECSKCDDPEPLSIFDCDLEIKRTGEGTNSTIQIPRWTATEMSEEMVKEFGRPYPFHEIFKGDPFKIQAKVLKVKNPYEDEADKHTGSYDDDKDAEDNPDYDE